MYQDTIDLYIAAVKADDWDTAQVHWKDIYTRVARNHGIINDANYDSTIAGIVRDAILLRAL